MKKFLLTIFLLIVSVAMATWPDAKHIPVPNGATLGWDNASGTWRPAAIDQNTGELAVTAEVSIGSITVEAFPVFANGLGEAATATIDAENRAIVNLGSDSIGLVDAISALQVAPVVATETKVLAANVAQEVGGNLTVRRWISISSDTDAEFWVDFGDTTAVGTVGVGYRTIGNRTFSVPADYLCNIIASTGMNLYIIEGGE
jgi:hypothetical protein